MAETSNLIRQINNPLRDKCQNAFRRIVERHTEVSLSSIYGVVEPEFLGLGLTDAMLLHLCRTLFEGGQPVLVSVDEDLLNAANSTGIQVIDFRYEFMGW